jgi:hypothetical protein
MTIRFHRFVARLVAAGMAICNALRIFVFGPLTYHPEQHYMRGPGPKWRQKHGVMQILAHDEGRG